MSIHAIVNGRMKARKGKGFSKAELRDVGLSLREALKNGIPIDPRRSTKHEENVKILETYTRKTSSKEEAKTPKTKARARIEEIEGIGPTYAKKLIAAGIRTTYDLLETGATPKGRGTLAAKTGISETLILEWVNLSDLSRIKGVGPEYADLLEETGVDTVVELARRVAENLHAKMLEVNEEKRLVRRLPTPSEVKLWIEEAKNLPRKVEY